MANKELQYQEDEIDLRQLMCILLASKKLIVVTTVIITLLAGIYAFTKTPIYEANALVEIGNYKLHNNDKASLYSAPDLVKKLNILFIDVFKNEKDRDYQISGISTPNNANNFIEIKAQAISNEIASRGLTKVVSYIQTKHQVILDDVRNRRELEINNINTKINNIKNKEMVLLSNKIELQTANLEDYKSQLMRANVIIRDIENTNPALTALKLMEKRDLSAFIADLSLRLMDMRNRKDKLETTAINDLIEQRALLESMLMPHNYKNSEVVGKIITSDYPIKPKKKLIVAVAFIAGLMLSIFLVFIMSTFRREEDKTTV